MEKRYNMRSPGRLWSTEETWFCSRDPSLAPCSREKADERGNGAEGPNVHVLCSTSRGLSLSIYLANTHTLSLSCNRTICLSGTSLSEVLRGQSLKEGAIMEE